VCHFFSSRHTSTPTLPSSKVPSIVLSSVSEMGSIIYHFLKLSPRSLDWNLSRSEGRADRRFTNPESATIATGLNPRSELCMKTKRLGYRDWFFGEIQIPTFVPGGVLYLNLICQALSNSSRPDGANHMSALSLSASISFGIQ